VVRGLGSSQYNEWRGTRLVFTVGVVKIEDASESSLFRRATLLDRLVPLEGVLAGESLPT